jgi:hypothetical protein
MKKGYFFTLDAFIAMSLLIICIVMIFSIQSSKPYPLQGIELSDDLMKLLANTKLYEIQSNYTSTLYSQGNITQLDNTLIEQIAWFYISNRSGLAVRFANNISSSILPGKYGFELRIYNKTTEYLISVNPGKVNQNTSRLIITSKRIIMGIENETAWGPMTAEVRLWQ